MQRPPIVENSGGAGNGIGDAPLDPVVEAALAVWGDLTRLILVASQVERPLEKEAALAVLRFWVDRAGNTEQKGRRGRSQWLKMFAEEPAREAMRIAVAEARPIAQAAKDHFSGFSEDGSEPLNNDDIADWLRKNPKAVEVAAALGTKWSEDTIRELLHSEPTKWVYRRVGTSEGWSESSVRHRLKFKLPQRVVRKTS